MGGNGVGGRPTLFEKKGRGEGGRSASPALGSSATYLPPPMNMGSLSLLGPHPHQLTRPLPSEHRRQPVQQSLDILVHGAGTATTAAAARQLPSQCYIDLSGEGGGSILRPAARGPPHLPPLPSKPARQPTPHARWGCSARARVHASAAEATASWLAANTCRWVGCC